MTITTLDQAIAGMQAGRFFFKAATAAIPAGRPCSYWGIGGIPPAGPFDITLNGVALSAPIVGQIPFVNPAAGLNTYLSRFTAEASLGGKLLLCDRLWHNGGFTAVTTPQLITSPTWPARDIDGATAGKGVFLGLEYNTTGAANAPNITVSYTNSVGGSPRTGQNTFATAASPVPGSFFPIGLNGADIGVRSVQSVTLTQAPTAGSCNLVAYRPIVGLEIAGVFTGNAIDLVTSGMPQLFDNSVPFLLFIPSNLSASNISGSLSVTQG